MLPLPDSGTRAHAELGCTRKMIAKSLAEGVTLKGERLTTAQSLGCHRPSEASAVLQASVPGGSPCNASVHEPKVFPLVSLRMLSAVTSHFALASSVRVEKIKTVVCRLVASINSNLSSIHQA